MNEKKHKIAEKWGISKNRGSIKVRAVRCNKAGCTKCPHMYYAYLRISEFGRTQEQYLGKCNKDGTPFYKTKDFLEKERLSIRKSKDK